MTDEVKAERQRVYRRKLPRLLLPALLAGARAVPQFEEAARDSVEWTIGLVAVAAAAAIVKDVHDDVVLIGKRRVAARRSSEDAAREDRQFKREIEATRDVAADIHQFVRGSLQELARVMALLAAAGWRPHAVEDYQRAVINTIVHGYGVGALASDLRVTVFSFKGEDPRALRLSPCEGGFGWNGKALDDIPPNSSRGRAVRRLMEEGDMEYVGDVSGASSYQLLLRSDEPCGAFVRVPIVNRTTAYGVMWIDGATPGSIPKGFTAPLAVMAFMLAVVFASSGAYGIERISNSEVRSEIVL